MTAPIEWRKGLTAATPLEFGLEQSTPVTVKSR